MSIRSIIDSYPHYPTSDSNARDKCIRGPDNREKLLLFQKRRPVAVIGKTIFLERNKA